MSHLAQAAAPAAAKPALSRAALLLAVLLACAGSKPGEAPAAAPSNETSANSLAAAEASDPAPEVTPDTEPAVDAAPATRTLFVGEALADCQGEAPQKCLQIRESEAEPYRNLYTSIEGFDYAPSYTYELRVEVVPVPNAPADGSALRYRLIEVVSRRKASAPTGN